MAKLDYMRLSLYKRCYSVEPRNFGITTQIPLDYKTVPPVLNKATKSSVVSGMKSIINVIMANGGNYANVIATFL